MSRFKRTCEACNTPCPKSSLMCFDCWAIVPAKFHNELRQTYKTLIRKYPTLPERQMNMDSPEFQAWANLSIEIISMVNPEAKSMLEFKEAVEHARG